MRKLFDAIRKRENDIVRDLIAENPDLVNSVATAPPEQDEGQSPLQVAIKTGNFVIVDSLLDRGADVNYSGGIGDEKEPVLHMAVFAAVKSCRHNIRHETGEGVVVEDISYEGRANAAFMVLQLILEKGANVKARGFRGATIAQRLCETAADILPTYSEEDQTVAEDAVVTKEWINDLGRIFMLLKEHGADFIRELEFYAEMPKHPVNGFLDFVRGVKTLEQSRSLLDLVVRVGDEVIQRSSREDGPMWSTEEKRWGKKRWTRKKDK